MSDEKPKPVVTLGPSSGLMARVLLVAAGYQVVRQEVEKVLIREFPTKDVYADVPGPPPTQAEIDALYGKHETTHVTDAAPAPALSREQRRRLRQDARNAEKAKR